MKITITWRVEQDDTDPRGNVLASGDKAADRAAEDEVIERLNRGDVWAWAIVTCRATCEVNGETFEGWDTLGGCSYEGWRDFRLAGGYSDSMKHAAIEHLKSNLRRAIERGEWAKNALKLAENRRKHTIEEVVP